MKKFPLRIWKLSSKMQTSVGLTISLSKLRPLPVPPKKKKPLSLDIILN
jgi:hypothetical protein